MHLHFLNATRNRKAKINGSDEYVAVTGQQQLLKPCISLSKFPFKLWLRQAGQKNMIKQSWLRCRTSHRHRVLFKDGAAQLHQTLDRRTTRNQNQILWMEFRKYLGFRRQDALPHQQSARSTRAGQRW
ncbi:hypothetical protein RB195_017988 [Necator americanus]|uniref:Uncharacterized protein n=1 Tax=Necator americanus TaxID=51031 RepID=A0ABR1C8P2_NECAM